MGMRKTGEAADVAEQDGGVARLAGARRDGFFGCRDLVGDLGREKPRQVLRRLAFGDRPVEQVARAVDGDGDDRGDQQDRDDLVEFRADQHRVVGHVIDVVAGHHLGAGGIDRVSRQPGPARGGDQPGGDDIARLEPQRPQRDEDEHIQQRRRFQVEGRRLLVLQMEAPDQAEQQAHVEHDRQVQHRRADRAAIGKREPDKGEEEIDAERPRHRRKIHIRREGLGRCRIEQPENHHHGKLEPADQAFGRVLLGRDARHDPRGQPGKPDIGIAEPKHG